MWILILTVIQLSESRVLSLPYLKTWNFERFSLLIVLSTFHVILFSNSVRMLTSGMKLPHFKCVQFRAPSLDAQFCKYYQIHMLNEQFTRHLPQNLFLLSFVRSHTEFSNYYIAVYLLYGSLKSALSAWYDGYKSNAEIIQNMLHERLDQDPWSIRAEEDFDTRMWHLPPTAIGWLDCSNA